MNVAIRLSTITPSCGFNFFFEKKKKKKNPVWWECNFFMSLGENFCTYSPSGLCTGKKKQAKRGSHSIIESRTSSSGVLNVPFSLLGGGKNFFSIKG